MAKKKGNKTPAPVNATVNDPVRSQKQQNTNKKTTPAAESNSFFFKYREQLIVAGIAIITYLFL